MLAKMVGRDRGRAGCSSGAPRFLKNHGVRNTRETSLAKWHATDHAVQSALDAIQVHGANGYCNEFPVERYLRNSKAAVIYEGTSQLHTLIQADYALGYREDRPTPLRAAARPGFRERSGVPSPPAPDGPDSSAPPACDAVDEPRRRGRCRAASGRGEIRTLASLAATFVPGVDAARSPTSPPRPSVRRRGPRPGRSSSASSCGCSDSPLANLVTAGRPAGLAFDEPRRSRAAHASLGALADRAEAIRVPGVPQAARRSSPMPAPGTSGPNPLLAAIGYRTDDPPVTPA